MIYPNDTHIFVLPLNNSNGSNPDVTVTPSITVINAISEDVVVPAAAMDLVTGSQKVYRFGWDTTGVSEGTYLSLISYAADGVTVQGRLLETVRLGDSRVTGKVALDDTVAKEATVAKDVDVLKASQYIVPKNDDYIRAIKSKVDLLPDSPVSSADIAGLAAKLEDVHDFAVGTWVVDKVNNTMTMRRKDGTVLQSFTLEDTGQYSNRVRA